MFHGKVNILFPQTDVYTIDGLFLYLQESKKHLGSLSNLGIGSMVKEITDDTDKEDDDDKDSDGPAAGKSKCSKFCNMIHSKQTKIYSIAIDKSGHPHNIFLPALVAQMAAHPTGDQEVAGSTPARSATFFHGALIMKNLLWPFSTFR